MQGSSIKANLDGEASVRGRIAYITGRNYVDGQAKREPVGGDDHWERATFWSSNRVLKFLNVVPEIERSTSRVHLVCGDREEPRLHYNLNTVKPVTKRGWYGADLQSTPAVKSLSNPEARTTTLTSSSKLTFSNTVAYSRQTLRALDTKCW